jgi:hypothetical protein
MGRCAVGVGDGRTGLSLSLPRSDTSALLPLLPHAAGGRPVEPHTKGRLTGEPGPFDPDAAVWCGLVSPARSRRRAKDHLECIDLTGSGEDVVRVFELVEAEVTGDESAGTDQVAGGEAQQRRGRAVVDESGREGDVAGPELFQVQRRGSVVPPLRLWPYRPSLQSSAGTARGDARDEHPIIDAHDRVGVVDHGRLRHVLPSFLAGSVVEVLKIRIGRGRRHLARRRARLAQSKVFRPCPLRPPQPYGREAWTRAS